MRPGSVADRNRTRNPRLRRPVLYPVELPRPRVAAAALGRPAPRPTPAAPGKEAPGTNREARIWSGWRDSNSRHLAPKASALPGCATPRGSPADSTRRPSPRSMNGTARFVGEIVACRTPRFWYKTPFASRSDTADGRRSASQAVSRLRPEKGRGIHEREAARALPQDPRALKDELSQEIERTVHTMQDEATCSPTRTTAPARSPTWRSNCATATASAS